MTKKEAARRQHMNAALQSLGFTAEECEALRRISMTLRAWHEGECGDSNKYGSWAIERDGDEDDSKPYRVYHSHRSKPGAEPTRTAIPDREKGAKKRLARIVARCNAYRSGLSATAVLNALPKRSAVIAVPSPPTSKPIPAAPPSTSCVPAIYRKGRRRTAVTRGGYVSTKRIDYYERRDDLRVGQIFLTTEGRAVKLDRTVPGDGTKWYVADWWTDSWAYMDSTIEPGDLAKQIPTYPLGDNDPH